MTLRCAKTSRPTALRTRRATTLAATLIASAAAFAAPSQIINPDGDPGVDRWVVPATQFDVGSLLTPADFTSFDFRLCGTLPENDAPTACGFSTDGTQIIVAGRESKNLIVWNAATRAFIRDIPLSGSPVDLAISPDGIHAVTANCLEDTISIINLSTGAETAVVPVGRVPGVVKITPDGTKAIVGNTTSSDFSIIDIAAATELRRIPGGSFSVTLSVNPESASIAVSYGSFSVANNSTIVHPRRFANPPSIALIDINTSAVTTLPSSAGPTEAAIRADGTRAYVSHTSAAVVSEVDIPGASILRTITAPATPWGPIAVNPGGTRAAVAIQNACVVMDIPSGTFGSSLSTASINQMLTTSDGLYALGVGFNGALMSYATQSLLVLTNTAVSTNFGAVSPTNPRAAMFSNTFGEDMVVVNTNGGAGFRESFTLSGPEPEGDRCRTVAVSPDGTRAIAVNIFSDTATVFDTATKTALAFIKTGERPSEVQFSPDGAKAVVANLDSTFATIINMSTLTKVDVPITRRASEVEISNDSRYAYLAVLADGDGVWRIDLSNNTVAGPKILTGDMGSVGYAYQQNSGMTLSPDGATLAICGSFTNNISLIDTASWSLITSFPCGSFPVEAAFSPDSSKIYVSSKNDDTVRECSNAGAGSAVLRTFTVGDQPWILDVSADGSKVFVANWASENIGVINVASGTQTATIALPDYPTGISFRDAQSRIYAVTGTASVTSGGSVGLSFSQDGELTQIDSTTNAVVSRVDLNLAPAGIATDPTGSVAIISCPNADGALLGGEPQGGCAADFNGDNQVDFFDYLDFAQAFNDEDPSADFNGDNQVDFFDYLDFAQAFDAGC
jgi:YVTN family beta-propeller protein